MEDLTYELARFTLMMGIQHNPKEAIPKVLERIRKEHADVLNRVEREKPYAESSQCLGVIYNLLEILKEADYEYTDVLSALESDFLTQFSLYVIHTEEPGRSLMPEFIKNSISEIYFRMQNASDRCLAMFDHIEKELER